MINWAAAEQTAKKQFGLITNAQLRFSEVTPNAVSRATRNRRMTNAHRGVFRFTAFPTSWEQRAFLPQLVQPNAAALSHTTAGWLYRLAGVRQPVRLSVKVARTTRLEIPGVDVHHVRDFHEPHHVRDFAVTSLGETVLDLASTLKREQFTFAFDSATRQFPREMNALFEFISTHELRGHEGATVVRRLFATRHGVILESPLESQVWTALVRSTLPLPTAQHPVADVMRVDFIWRNERVILHVDSRQFHATRGELERDAMQRNRLATDWVSFVVTRASLGRDEWLTLLHDALRRRAPQLRLAV